MDHDDCALSLGGDGAQSVEDRLNVPNVVFIAAQHHIGKSIDDDQPCTNLSDKCVKCLGISLIYTRRKYWP